MKTKKHKCCVIGCNEEWKGSWIDIIDDTSKAKDQINFDNRNFGRLPFCEKHFEIVMPFLDQKEKEMQKHDDIVLEDGTRVKEFHWCFAPLSLVIEALQ